MGSSIQVYSPDGCREQCWAVQNQEAGTSSRAATLGISVPDTWDIFCPYLGTGLEVEQPGYELYRMAAS